MLYGQPSKRRSSAGQGRGGNASAPRVWKGEIDMPRRKNPIFPIAMAVFLFGVPGYCRDSSRPVDGVAAIEIRDAAGKTVQLDKLPERLVVVGRGPQYILHLLYMFPEGPGRLVGMEKRGRTASDFLSALSPDIESKPTLLPNPGPESIAGLHPDLVLMKGAEFSPLGEALA
mgnify:CR=1 FL=1